MKTHRKYLSPAQSRSKLGDSGEELRRHACLVRLSRHGQCRLVLVPGLVLPHQRTIRESTSHRFRGPTFVPRLYPLPLATGCRKVPGTATASRYHARPSSSLCLLSASYECSSALPSFNRVNPDVGSMLPSIVPFQEVHSVRAVFKVAAARSTVRYIGPAPRTATIHQVKRPAR